MREAHSLDSGGHFSFYSEVLCFVLWQWFIKALSFPPRIYTFVPCLAHNICDLAPIHGFSPLPPPLPFVFCCGFIYYFNLLLFLQFFFVYISFDINLSGWTLCIDSFLVMGFAFMPCLFLCFPCLCSHLAPFSSAATIDLDVKFWSQFLVRCSLLQSFPQLLL